MTAVKNIIRRITLFYFLTVLLSLLITGQIIYLQFFTELKARAEVIKTKPVEASRGNIYAHDMRLLATSIPKYEIRVDFYAMKTNIIENDAYKMSFYYDKLRKDFKNEIAKLKPAERKIKKEEIKKRREELENRIKEHRKSDTVNASIYLNNEIKKLSDSLSNLFKNKTAAEYESFIKTCCRKSIKKQNDTTEETYRYVRMGRRNINYIELKKLLEFPIFAQGKGLCGLRYEEKTERIPFYGSLGLATIGYVNSNGLALMGIERSFDEYLKGKDGLQAVIGERPINNQKNTLPEQGYDIVSALDINIQESVEKALMRQIILGNERGINIEGGTAVVMEVKSVFRL